jgi:hypothetical protein
MSANQEERELALIRRSLGDGSVVSMKYDYKENSREKFRVTLVSSVPRAIRIGSVQGLPIEAPLVDSPVASFLPPRGRERHSRYDFTCSNAEAEEDYLFKFPPSVKILSVPKNFKFKNEVIQYDAEYVQEGQTVRVLRTYIDRTKGPICKPLIDIYYHEAAEAIREDLKAQIVIE